MFFFYQIRSHYHKSLSLLDETCTNCNNRGAMKIHFLQNYAWMFGPIFPSNKFAIVECDVCQNKLPNKLWTKQLDLVYKEEKKKLKTPFRMWRGLLVMAMIFIIPYTLMKLRIVNPMNFKRVNQSESVNKINVKNFKENDILFVSIFKYSDDSAGIDYFTLAKILKIEGDKTTIVKYSEKFEFVDQYDVSLSDINNSKFMEEIEIKTEALRKYENLMYYKSPTKKMEFIAFGTASSVIKE